jgi:hypothetical protein
MSIYPSEISGPSAHNLPGFPGGYFTPNSRAMKLHILFLLTLQTFLFCRIVHMPESSLNGLEEFQISAAMTNRNLLSSVETETKIEERTSSDKKAAPYFERAALLHR